MAKVLIILLLCFAHVATAQVSISEIMYDPEGSDAGHEWVAVVNQGSEKVDLLQCKFVEGGSNHNITDVQKGALLGAGEYAVIADNAQTFLSDHPSFSGIVVDSSFSLKNTGETLAFKMPNGIVSDTVTYAGGMGAAGDGNSLQKIAGMWVAKAPSFGGANSSVSTASTPSSASSGTVSSPTNSSLNISAFPVEPQIIADAGVPTRIVSAGATVVFAGKVFGLKKEPIENARLYWTFGDGGYAEGVSVNHVYYYPGEYIAVLDASSGYYSASDRITIKAVTPLISLRAEGTRERSFVTLKNSGTEELDLSNWQISSNGKIFTLPKNTIVGAQKSVNLASEVTGLETPLGSAVELRFPNGAPVEVKKEANVSMPAPAQKSAQTTAIKNNSPAYVPPSPPQEQTASVSNAFAGAQTLPANQENGGLWVWYTSIAFLAASALLGIRYSKKEDEPLSITADDFDIFEDEEPH